MILMFLMSMAVGQDEDRDVGANVLAQPRDDRCGVEEYIISAAQPLLSPVRPRRRKLLAGRACNPAMTELPVWCRARIMGPMRPCQCGCHPDSQGLPRWRGCQARARAGTGTDAIKMRLRGSDVHSAASATMMF